MSDYTKNILVMKGAAAQIVEIDKLVIEVLSGKCVRRHGEFAMYEFQTKGALTRARIDLSDLQKEIRIQETLAAVPEDNFRMIRVGLDTADSRGALLQHPWAHYPEYAGLLRRHEFIVSGIQSELGREAMALLKGLASHSHFDLSGQEGALEYVLMKRQAQDLLARIDENNDLLEIEYTISIDSKEKLKRAGYRVRGEDGGLYAWVREGDSDTAPKIAGVRFICEEHAWRDAYENALTEGEVKDRLLDKDAQDQCVAANSCPPRG